MPSNMQTLLKNYAKRRGISEEKAMEELRKQGFNFEPEATPEEAISTTEESHGEPGPLETTLTGTARSLGAVATIQGLQKAVNQGASTIPTFQEMMSYRMARDMFREDEEGGDRKRGGGVTQEELRSMLEENKKETQAMIEESENKRLGEENARLRAEQEEAKRREERAAELQPLYDSVAAMTKSVSDLSAQVAKVGTPQEKSEALQVAETLAASVRDLKDTLTAAVGPKAPQAEDAMTQIDKTLGVISRIEEKLRPAKAGVEGAEGGLDWKALAISELGETGRAFLSEWRKIQAAGGGASSGNTEGQLSEDQLNEIKVGAYVANVLKNGQAQLDVYEAAKVLGLTPEKTMKAMQSLQAKGQITMGEPPSQPNPPPQGDQSATPGAKQVIET